MSTPVPQADRPPQSPLQHPTYAAEVQRPLNPMALRRSWNEPSVRSWWLMALMLGILILWLIAQQFISNREVNYWIGHWTPVKARIDKIAGSSRVTYRVEPDLLAVTESELSYADPTGAEHHVKGRLPGQTQPRHPSDVIPLLIDPANSEHWTDRTALPPLAERMMIPVLFLPLPVLLGLIALVQRRRMLHLWQTGLQRDAKVVHVQQSATSPWSSLLHCALEQSRDTRLRKVTVPHRKAMPKPGDSIQLIVTEGGSLLSLAAMLYQ